MKEIIIFAFIIALFLTASFFVAKNAETFKELVALSGIKGMFFYIFITITAIVLAPAVSTLPLLPVAAALWGSFLSAILTIIGWEIGAMIAFGLAQKYGHPLLHKITADSKINRIRRLIPEKNLFLSVILFRIILPVDVLSYVLGLFTNMRFIPYATATLLGIIPFAFIFSHAVKLPISYQIFAGILGLIFIYLGYRRLSGLRPKIKT